MTATPQPWLEANRRTAVKDCQKCGGESVWLNDAGEAVDCDCAPEAQLQRIITYSRVPKRFANAGFRGFVPPTPSVATQFGYIKDWLRRLSTHQTSDGLLLHGPVGTGKTHLACACARNLAQDGWWFLFYSVPQMLFDLRQTVSRDNDDNEGDILEPAMTVPLLVLDDFGAEKLTDYARERLYLVFDSRYEKHLPTIVTTNLSMEGLARWDARIASRIEGTCMVCELVGPDYRKKIAKQMREQQLDGSE